MPGGEPRRPGRQQGQAREEYTFCTAVANACETQWVDRIEPSTVDACCRNITVAVAVDIAPRPKTDVLQDGID